MDRTTSRSLVVNTAVTVLKIYRSTIQQCMRRYNLLILVVFQHPLRRGPSKVAGGFNRVSDAVPSDHSKDALDAFCLSMAWRSLPVYVNLAAFSCCGRGAYISLKKKNLSCLAVVDCFHIVPCLGRSRTVNLTRHTI